jgi:hypothetical protein
LQVDCAFRFCNSSCFSGWRNCAQGAKLCKTLRCSKKPPNTTGPKKARRATPTARRASLQRLIDFFDMIAICKKSDKCGTTMMLLHGDHNGGAVILAITRLWGRKSWSTIRHATLKENLSHTSVHSACQILMIGQDLRMGSGLGLRLIRHDTAKGGQARNRRFCLEVPIATIINFQNSAISMLARPQQCAEGALLL